MATHGKEIKIFAGNSNVKMAEDIARTLGLKLGNATISRFADGEISVSIGESVRGADVFLVQSTCKPVNHHLMELLIMIDACQRASANRITAVIPYFGYARQDRKVKARDPISAKLVADIITAAGANRVLTMDLHAQQVQGFFNIPLDHLISTPIFLDYFKKRFGAEQKESLTVVAPDLGSVARTRAFAERLDAPLAIIDKRRPKANESEVMNIIGDVKGKQVVLIDDIIDTAGTLCNAATALIEIGGATKVFAAATHAILSDPAMDRIIDSPLEEVVVMDTIPLTQRAIDSGKFVQLTAAPLFARAIRNIYEEEPVSPLYL